MPDVESLTGALDEVDYLTDPGLATALFLAVRLPQPLPGHAPMLRRRVAAGRI